MLVVRKRRSSVSLSAARLLGFFHCPFCAAPVQAELSSHVTLREQRSGIVTVLWTAQNLRRRCHTQAEANRPQPVLPVFLLMMLLQRMASHGAARAVLQDLLDDAGDECLLRLEPRGHGEAAPNAPLWIHLLTHCCGQNSRPLVKSPKSRSTPDRNSFGTICPKAFDHFERRQIETSKTPRNARNAMLREVQVLRCPSIRRPTLRSTDQPQHTALGAP